MYVRRSSSIATRGQLGSTNNDGNTTTFGHRTIIEEIRRHFQTTNRDSRFRLVENCFKNASRKHGYKFWLSVCQFN